MGKMKEFVIDIDRHLVSLYASIGLDSPANHDEIVDFVSRNVLETAHPVSWHSGDVVIAFRRWIESKTNTLDDKSQLIESNYFKVKKNGYDSKLQRDEIQIHAGKNGNVLLIKTDEGFVIDVYGQQDHHSSMTVWEEDIAGDDD